MRGWRTSYARKPCKSPAIAYLCGAASSGRSRWRHGSGPPLALRGGAALELSADHPEDGYGLVLVTDGMSAHAESAAALLRELDLHASIVPFGSESPFVKAAWEQIDVLQLYEHPGANLRRLARSIALGVMWEGPGGGCARSAPGCAGFRLRRLRRTSRS